jgi:branched-subunit amino acid aminotransferase/4-amino-4-deoxychorismate lyase
MVKYLLKKSYRLKDLKEIEFNDLWGDHGVFTTMWIFDGPSKILFFKNHINNLMKSTRAYSIKKSSIRSDILKLLKKI